MVSVGVKPKPLTAEMPRAFARRRSLIMNPFLRGHQCLVSAPCPFFWRELWLVMPRRLVVTQTLERCPKPLGAHMVQGEAPGMRTDRPVPWACMELGTLALQLGLLTNLGRPTARRVDNLWMHC